MSRHQYPLDMCRVFERTTSAKVQDALASKRELENSLHVEVTEVGDTVSDVPKGKQNRKNTKSNDSSKAKGASSKQLTLKVALGEALGYGPGILEHIILDAGLAPNLKLTKDFELDNAVLQSLLKAIEKFEDWLEDVIKGEKIPEGYILMQRKVLGNDSSNSETQSSIQVLYFAPALIIC